MIRVRATLASLEKAIHQVNKINTATSIKSMKSEIPHIRMPGEFKYIDLPDSTRRQWAEEIQGNDFHDTRKCARHSKYQLG